MNITDLVREAHENATKHGWWESNNIPEKIALIHSEVSEALEDYRNDRMGVVLNSGKPEGFGTELADIIIRVADLAGRLGIPLEAIVEAKMKYNATRPYRHGGKRC